jgi:outer membrane protein assembly factor BamA
VSFGLSLPVVRLRRTHTVYGAFNIQRDTLTGVGTERTYRRNSIRTAWAFNNARVFGRSISPEQGVAVALTSEQVRRAFGGDGGADAFTGEIRGYLRAGAPHAVLAARLALGAANGDPRVARVFHLGGAQGAGSLVDFGSSAFSMLRGFESKEFAASHVGAANVEYRFPLLRVDRGRGTWPVLLRTFHAAVFADAGQVWDHRFSLSDTRASFGAELSLDVVVGFALPLTLSAGVARPWDGDRFRNPAAYVRVGRSF